MKVTVLDRALQSRLWGRGYRTIDQILKTIEIADECQVCGGPRGAPAMRRQCEDDEWYDVSRWSNPCGHVDQYADVIKEAEALGGGSPPTESGAEVHRQEVGKEPRGTA